MNLKKRELIKDLTDKLRRDYQLEIPFSKSLDDFLENLGGRLEYIDSKEFFGSSLEFPEKVWDKQFVILLNQRRTRQQQEYEIAYQIGNLFINTNYLKVCTKKEESLQVTYNLKETKAIQGAIEFADNLMMPQEEFSEEVRKHTKDGMVNMLTVANRFNVTWGRAVARGKALNLIKSEF